MMANEEKRITLHDADGNEVGVMSLEAEFSAETPRYGSHDWGVCGDVKGAEFSAWKEGRWKCRIPLGDFAVVGWVRMARAPGAGGYVCFTGDSELEVELP